MKKEITTKTSELKQYAFDKPAEMAKMASVLKHHIIINNLFTEISGKNYVHVEGWAYAGSMLGMIPMVEKVTDLSKPTEVKWLAEACIYKNDKVMSRGIAICSNKENKKKSFDEYAVLSMAQTRSIGKAYRNLIGWVIKLAGYEGTPSEEMTKMGEKPQNHVHESTVVDEESQLPKHVCSKCDAPISDAVAEFSMKKCKKKLCRECLLEIAKKKK